MAKLLFGYRQSEIPAASACFRGTGRTEGELQKIADDVEIDQAMAKNWLHILESMDIVFLLHPYANNLLKRTVSTPKLYFYDTGLVC